MRINEFPTPKRKLSALQSIKFYCKELCCCGDTLSWKHCTAEKCALHRYRLGLGNKTKKRITEEKVPSTLQDFDKIKEIQPNEKTN